jgi:hypothetical protein
LEGQQELQEARTILVASIFTDINLPNPTTWFYFSGLLAVALFFKFGRLFSLRNLDVLTLFLFGPGFLLLTDAARMADAAQAGQDEAMLEASRAVAWQGYAFLLLASSYFLGRCLFDVAMERRPALAPNLDLAGLAWLAAALFISLIAVSARQPLGDTPEPAPKAPTDPLPSIAERVLPEVSEKVAGRVLALACHLSVVAGLILAGWRVFENLQSGMAAATFYLLLPYTFFLVPGSLVGVGRWDHAWPMAFLVWSVVFYRWPTLAGVFLGLAMGPSPYLLVTLPAWLGFYGQRGWLRFLLGFLLAAGLGLGLMGGLAWAYQELPSGLRSPWTTSDWQPWRRPSPDIPGFWQLLPGMVGKPMVAYRVPVFLASMALVALSAFWPRPRNLGQTIALSAAALISIQLWHADRGGVYVLWYLPLVLLLVFRPNMSEHVAPELPADGWPTQVGRWAARQVARLMPRKPEAVTPPGG